MALLTPSDQLDPQDLAGVLQNLGLSNLGQAFQAFAEQALGRPLADGLGFSTGIAGLYQAVFGLMTPQVLTMPEQTIRGDNVAHLLDGGASFAFAGVPSVIDAWWRVDAAPGQTVTSVTSVLDPTEEYAIHLADLPGDGLGTDHTIHGGRTLARMAATGGLAMGLRVQTDDSSDATVHGFAVVQFCR